jgi:SAM-dependent methyltransferase
MPTNWEERYQTGDTPWENGAPSPGLVDYLATHRSLRGRVLVPGCGLGHDVRAIAPGADEVVGIDISPSAVARAAEMQTPSGRVRFQVADLFNLPPEMRGAFDWVWEHTCFCAIDPSQRPAYVDAVASALKPGGHLLAVFYLDPGNTSPDEGPPFEVSIAELNRLFAPRFELVDEWLPTHTYPGRENREWMRLLRVRT